MFGNDYNFFKNNGFISNLLICLIIVTKFCKMHSLEHLCLMCMNLFMGISFVFCPLFR